MGFGEQIDFSTFFFYLKSGTCLQHSFTESLNYGDVNTLTAVIIWREDKYNHKYIPVLRASTQIPCPKSIHKAFVNLNAYRYIYAYKYVCIWVYDMRVYMCVRAGVSMCVCMCVRKLVDMSG